MKIRIPCVPILVLSLAVPAPGLAAEGFSPERLIRDLTGGVKNLFSNVLQTRGAKLRQLAADGQYDEAARYWAAEKEFFAPRQQEYEDVLKTIAANLNEKYDNAVAGPSERLWKITSDSTSPAQWAQIRADRQAVQSIVKAYEQVELLRLDPFRSQAVAGAEKLLAEVDQKLRSAAPAAFGRYDHLAGKSFFVDYPVQLPASFLESNFEALRPQLAKATQPQIARFVEVYAPVLGGREQALLTSLYLDQEARAGARSIPRILAALEAAAKMGVKVPAENALSVVNIAPRQGTAGSVPLAVVTPPQVAVENIEIEQLRQKLAARDGLVIVLQARDARTERRVTERNKVTSQMIPATGATSTQAKPAFTSYSFDTATAVVTKRADIQVSVLDLRRRTLAQATYPYSQERKFTAASGIKPEDPDFYSLAQHYQTTAAVEEFERSAPAVSLTEVAQVLNNPSVTERTFASLDQLYAALQPPQPVIAEKTVKTTPKTQRK